MQVTCKHALLVIFTGMDLQRRLSHERDRVLLQWHVVSALLATWTRLKKAFTVRSTVVYNDEVPEVRSVIVNVIGDDYQPKNQ